MAAVVVALAVGCAGGGSSSSSGTTDGTTTGGTPVAVPVYHDPRQPIRVPLGREFVISLAADPRSGTSWRPAPPPDPTILLSIGTSFRTDGNHVDQLLLYGGRGYGTTVITLHYVGPRRSSAVLRTVSFTVTVYNPRLPTTTTSTSTTSTLVGSGVGATFATSTSTTYVPLSSTTSTTLATTTSTLATTTTSRATTTTKTTTKP